MKVAAMPLRNLFSILHQLVRYGASGISSFLFDLTLLYFFITLLSLPYYVAVPLAFVIAATAHYGLCRAWVFRGSPRPLGTGYVYFLLILFSSLLLVLSTVTLLVEFFAVNVYIARVAASIVAGFMSFYLNSALNFRTLRHYGF